jgi:hypothetical protein
MTGEHVALAIHQAGLVTPLLQGLAAVIAIIDIPHIVPSNGLHELGNRQRLARCHPQMERVGHQHIGMYLAVVPLRRLAQAIEAAVIILLSEERGNSRLLPRWRTR